MRKDLTETIDGIEITVAQLPVMKALRTLNRVARVVAPALGEGAEAFTTPGSLASADIGAIGRMASALFSKLEDDEVEGLARVLLEGARLKKGGKSVPLVDVMDEVFLGKPATFLKVLAFAFRANYGDFIGALRGLSARAGMKTEEAEAPESTSPST